jgi:hypothetical protein
MIASIPYRRILFIAMVVAFLEAGVARADKLGELPLEVRAALAAAVTANPVDKNPGLDYEKPTFDPAGPGRYLKTYNPGKLYAVQISEGSHNFYLTIEQFKDEAEAAAAFKSWVSDSDSSKQLDWPEVGFPVYSRGAGLLGIAGSGMGTDLRGQSGFWHFEVSVVTQAAGRSTGGVESDEVAAARPHLLRLIENARRYRLFPYELVIEYTAPGRQALRLMGGQPFNLPLSSTEQTAAVFDVKVVGGDGTELPKAKFKVQLTGPLARFAKADRDGNVTLSPIQEFDDRGSAEVRWQFPSLRDQDLSAAIGDLPKNGDDLSLQVEATFPRPGGGPPS